MEHAYDLSTGQVEAWVSEFKVSQLHGQVQQSQRIKEKENKKRERAEGMAGRIEVLAAKSDDPSSNPGTTRWKRTDSSK